ncbi:uncharacterized protein C8R40DRAFT_238730 [Lentinula edodes]|uniref:uncharacterized protein n=1 Tax=Lentinula edodes TaxID=5353 RepID=UPI001E8EE27A|nr:uncharacterized protein C8R40DRAFT_238730 [Lentinula edodes]KAH7874976.1 hypothetical protein C8R40DRAFT_238730 [Lentinula edodes]
MTCIHHNLSPSLHAVIQDSPTAQSEIADGVDAGMQSKIKEIIEKHGLHPSFLMSPTFTETWGCQMIAYMLNAVLYGASLILTLHYFRSYSQIDSGGVQTMFNLFGTLQFIFLSHQVYTDYVIRFSQIAQLDDIVVSGIVSCIFLMKRLRLSVCSTKQTSYNYLLRI